MAIRPSSSTEVRHLIESLGGSDDVAREAAIARIAVIGPRAIEHLLHEFPAAAGPLRAGILAALERAADPRAWSAAKAGLDDPSPDVQLAAIGAVRALLGSSRQEVARDALDALVAVALDTRRPAALRLGAIDALKDLPADIRRPLDDKLAADPDPEVRKRTGAAPRGAPLTWADVVDGRLPSTPSALKALLQNGKGTARLTELQRTIDHVRAREQREADPVVREEWRAVRGALHQALAARSSRLALYDLRDSLMDAERLPVAFLAALEEIGDASCLEPLAAAYDASSRSSDMWWREHVAAAFRAIMQREGLTRRHAAVKRTMARWPEAAGDLIGRL